MKYYVYELVDPCCGEVFYIGKGTGNRWKHHMYKSRRKSRHNAGNFLKDMILDALRRAGMQPICRKVGLFADAAAAYAFEAECIAEARKTNRYLANYNDGIST